MKCSPRSPTTPPAGGRFAPDLDESLSRTLAASAVDLRDLMTAGWTVEELAKALASTPPFSEVLVAQVRQHLLAIR